VPAPLHQTEEPEPMKDHLVCPKCGGVVARYRNPFPTVDIIIEMNMENVPEPASGPDGGETGPPERGPRTEKHPPSRPVHGGENGPAIVLIKRKNPPFGWALPGGFVDYGESLESAARREAAEETCLEVELLYQLGAYSDPSRDPRHHTISVVFVGRATGTPKAADDAQGIGVFDRYTLPDAMAFDHQKILSDYFQQWHSRG